MTDKSREQNLEYVFFALAFGLALGLRLLRLGETPLGDDEARWALQSLSLAKGLGAAIGPQPAYVNLTALVIFLLQASNFAARLVPALFGAALTLLPYNFKDILGRKAAILLAFLISFDPGFLALSRLAGSPILAITAVLFAWGALRKRKLRAAGIWAGVGLLSGPVLWPGLIGLGISYGLSRGLPDSNQDELSEDAAAEKPVDGADAESHAALPEVSPDPINWLNLGLVTVLTYIFLGSFFSLAAGGLGAGLASIPAYFGGWLSLSNISIASLLAGLSIYELMALVLALVAVVRGILNHDKRIMGLGLWLLVSLIFALVYPARQFSDLGWVLVPLLTMAALELSEHLIPIENGSLETIGMAVFTFAILVFIVLNYFSLAMVPTEPAAEQLRWWILLGAFGLLIISLGMVAFGWSVPTAVQGGVWGTLAVLLIFTFASAMASAGLRTYRTLEMWSSGAYIDQSDTLISQMNDLSRWKDGVNANLDVTLAGIDSPALLWTLRDWPVSIVPDVNLSTSSPAILIAPEQATMSTEVQANYRGQDLNWRISPLWEQGLLLDWMNWSILHQFPKNDEKIILWVRNDIFVDSQNN